MRIFKSLLSDTRVRFLLIGGWNMLFGYLVFWLLYEVFRRLAEVHYFAYTGAQVGSFVIAVPAAYFLHKRVTFRSEARGSAAWREFFRFVQLYLAMFVFGLVLLPFLVEGVGLDPRLAAIVVTGVTVVVSYVGHRFRTFR
jgi:putative flippase GtrA